MAYLEDTLDDASPVNNSELASAGEEVEVFAKYLDECIIQQGSVPEQRALIFKLVDDYYGYARERADVLRERVRLARLARGSSGDSTASSAVQGARGGATADGDTSGMDLDDQTEPQRPKSSEGDAASAQRWEEEAQTWDLMRRLLPLRYRDKSASAAAGFQPRRAAVDRLPQTRREYWADFLVSEPKARERKTVLEWLQTSANSAGPDIDEVVQELQRNAERGEIVAHGWLHTRGAIKQHKRLVATSEPLDPENPDLEESNLDHPHKLVTQLDPDVVTRQQDRKLAPQDAFFEQAIWLGCYELLRRGRSLSDIRDWCVERTEIWRAASVSALPLASGGDDDVPNFDSLSTILWRRLCYRLAQEGSAGLYERAVYGILSGDLTTVEAISKTWDDLTFAKYNADLRSQFDAYLIRQSDAASVHSLLLLHGGIPVSQSDARDREERVNKAANTPAKALQAAMLDEKLDALLYQQGLLLAEQANAERPSKLIPKYDGTSAGVGALVKAGGDDDATKKFVDPTDSHGLRVLAHVLIVVSALDRLDGKGRDVATLGPMARRHQTEEHVVAGYISFLRLARLEDLIPLYSSKLMGDRCYTNMALNLIHIEEREIQVRLLHLMQKLGLDVVKFVKTLPQLFLADVSEKPGVCPAHDSFVLLQGSAPTLKFGRLLRPDIFGPVSDNAIAGLLGANDEDADDEVIMVDKKDELLIRSLEWMLLVDGLVLETCDYGVRIYKYFFKNEHLAAARIMAGRVPCSEIIRQKTKFGGNVQDEGNAAWWDDLFDDSAKLSGVGDAMDEDTFGNGLDAVSKSEVLVHARPFFELECLANALDCMETTAITARFLNNPSQVSTRNVAKTLDESAKTLKGLMKPLLKDWLLESVDDDPDYVLLRETYLPQVVIGYTSTLHFTGTTTSRDYLLECMELAALIAEPGSDVAKIMVETGHMRELVESFASCSKALAIWTGDIKRGSGGASNKKTRELGWSRELWSVK